MNRVAADGVAPLACAMARPLDAVTFDNSFVRELPGDPSDEPRRARCAARATRACQPDAGRARRACSRGRDEVGGLLGLERPRPTTACSPRCSAATACCPGMQPYAACYGGHQFGNWAGQLGDGRAITLGEVIDARRQALGAAAEGRGPDAVLAHAPTVARCCARRCASSCAARRCTTSACRPRARCRLVAHRRAGGARHVLRRPPASPSPARSCAASRRRSCASATSRSSPRAASSTLLQQLADYVIAHALPRARRAVARRSYARWFDEVCRRTAALIVALDARRLRARRDEHRQHVDPRAHHRLRPVRLARGLRPGLDAEHHRRRGRAATATATSREIALWNLVQLANALVPLVGDAGRRWSRARRLSRHASSASYQAMLARQARARRSSRARTTPLARASCSRLSRRTRPT